MNPDSIVIELRSPRMGMVRQVLPANTQSDVVVSAMRQAICVFSLMFDEGERAAFLRELGSDITVLAHEVE